MRFVIGFIGAACLCGVSPAQSDPPSSALATEEATPAATPSATQPASGATNAAPADSAQGTQPAAPAKDAKQTVVVQGSPEVDQLEKHFLSEGYKLEMHNGEKYFCRREEELGSRLGGKKVCSTGQQLQATEREARAAYQRGQSQQNNPKGN
jgi:hypothetical protein